MEQTSGRVSRWHYPWPCLISSDRMRACVLFFRPMALKIEVMWVDIHGFFGHAQPGGELIIAKSIAYQVKHIDLPGRGATFHPNTVQAEVAGAEEEHSDVRRTLTAEISTLRDRK